MPIPEPEFDTLAPTHTVVPILRGLDGEFAGWREVHAPPPAAAPTASSSMDRAPGGQITFVRGKGSYVPFKPGGMEPGQYRGERALGSLVEDEAGGEEEDENDEDAAKRKSEEDGKAWKSVAPGMKKGMDLTGGE